jgi:tetratricopeptide (TPR) repeat protein
VYWIEKKYEVAAECFGKVLELDQNNPAAQYHLALCMQKLKKYKQAFVLINELVKNGSEDVEQKAQFLGGRANVLRDL